MDRPGKSRRFRRHVHSAAAWWVAALLFTAVLPAVGCVKSAPKSAIYFALSDGNSWLYEGGGTGEKLQVEMKVVKPDPALKLREGISDLSITGSLGNMKVSEQGLFLETTPVDVKLWGIKQAGAGAPQFFNTPYVWLQQPLQVGRRYNTAITGTPTPALMEVTGQARESTPWGEMDAFQLQEKSGAGPAGSVRLTFVPYLGFTSIYAPELGKLVLKDASVK